jgi:hypothetical protein
MVGSAEHAASPMIRHLAAGGGKRIDSKVVGYALIMNAIIGGGIECRHFQ